MAEHVHTDSRFAEILEAGAAQHKKVVIKFGAKWCGPCNKVAPRFDQWATQLGDQAYLVSIDIDQLPEVATTFKVSSIPAFVIVDNLKATHFWTGGAANILDQHLTKHFAQALGAQQRTVGAIKSAQSAQ